MYAARKKSGSGAAPAAPGTLKRRFICQKSRRKVSSDLVLKPSHLSTKSEFFNGEFVLQRLFSVVFRHFLFRFGLIIERIFPDGCQNREKGKKTAQNRRSLFKHNAVFRPLIAKNVEIL